jgi:hypothetical protein
MILERKPAIRVLFFRQEKSFQDHSRSDPDPVTHLVQEECETREDDQPETEPARLTGNPDRFAAKPHRGVRGSSPR